MPLPRKATGQSRTVSLTGRWLDDAIASFDDTGVQPNVVVAAGGVSPFSTVFNQVTNPYNYVFSGGPIGGPSGVTLNGTGTVTFTNDNTYSRTDDHWSQRSPQH